MSFKKILPVLFLLSAPFACTDDKKKAPTSVEQTAQTPAAESAAQAPAPIDAITPPATPAEKSPTPSPTAPDAMTTSYEGAFVRMIVTLLGLVVLVVATFWILKRMGKGKFGMGSGRGINVVEKRAISPKSMLYVVEVGGKKVLISESQLEVRALTTIEEIPDVNE